MVSGLWQYRHFNLQPCKKITNRIPGPSWVPKDSIECTLKIFFVVVAVVVLISVVLELKCPKN